MIVLLESLSQRPLHQEAQDTRRCVNLVFSLVETSQGLVAGSSSATVRRPLHEGGFEAWDLISRMRRQVWQTMGWDPDEGWTREEAVEICQMELGDLTDNRQVIQDIARDAAQQLRRTSLDDSDDDIESSNIDEEQVDELMTGTDNWALLGSERYGSLW